MKVMSQVWRVCLTAKLAGGDEVQQNLRPVQRLDMWQRTMVFQDLSASL